MLELCTATVKNCQSIIIVLKLVLYYSWYVRVLYTMLHCTQKGEYIAFNTFSHVSGSTLNAHAAKKWKKVLKEDRFTTYTFYTSRCLKTSFFSIGLLERNHPLPQIKCHFGRWGNKHLCCRRADRGEKAKERPRRRTRGEGRSTFPVRRQTPARPHTKERIKRKGGAM